MRMLDDTMFKTPSTLTLGFCGPWTQGTGWLIRKMGGARADFIYFSWRIPSMRVSPSDNNHWADHERLELLWEGPWSDSMSSLIV